ncbi:Cytochrome P450, putative [Theobroma cacao]|uniref:Cytochrome P450, putative n=1 Tax=Theobroma cacao TaxID=3641 RepID=A0A061FDH0_THECC|nr:Cytochrome P450, putative [Theobroma cacao]
MVVLLFFVLAVPSLFLFILPKDRDNGNSPLPPGPSGLPFIGHLHMQMLDNLAPHIFLWKLSQKYGSLMSLRFGFRPILVVSSAETAKEVMKTHDLDCCSRPTLLGGQKLSYNGLDLAFSPYSAYWREIRKICVVHLFNLNRVQIYRPIREDEVARLIAKISKLSVNSKPVNLSEAIMCLTSTIICRIGFSKRYEEGVKRSRLHGLLNESQALLMSFCVFDYFPCMDWNVFIGGTDTSAATVIWVMTFLMKNPRCLKKIQEEVKSLVGKKCFVNEDDIQSLTYFKAVIKEAFRLQPIAPLLVPRETMRKCNIGGNEIPAKTLIHVNAWAIGRDPQAWKNPKEFYSERFIGSSIDYKGLDFELIPFGAGRRGCPGIHMGVATLELALANLLYKFDWEMPAGMNKEDLDFDVIPGITMHKKNALCLVAHEIDVY